MMVTVTVMMMMMMMMIERSLFMTMLTTMSNRQYWKRQCASS